MSEPIGSVNPMDDFQYENNRLKAELEKFQKLNDLLKKFRIYLINYLEVCKCDQFLDKTAVKDLDDEYQVLLKERSTVSDVSAIKEELEDSNQTIDQSFDYISCSGISEQMFTDFDDTNDGQTVDETTDSLKTLKKTVGPKYTPKFVCEEEDCGLKFENKKQFAVHLKIVHKIDETVEPIAKKMKMTEEESETDNKKTGEQNYVCDEEDCGQTFENKKKLSIHLKNVHKCVKPIGTPAKKTEISICTEEEYETDNTMSGDPKYTPNYVCDEEDCGLKFENKKQFAIHLKIVHKIDETVKQIETKSKRFACDWIGCGKTFSGQQDMILHIRNRHTFEKPFSCDFCDKSFALKKLLTNHLLKHTDKDKYKCDYEDCIFSTTHSYLLSHHIQVKHLNKKRYECDADGCNRSYKYEFDLKRHKSLDHHPLGPQKPNKCYWPGCETSFKKAEALQTHIARHKNERKHRCDYEGCSQAFNLAFELRRHQALHTDTYYKHPCSWPGCTVKATTPGTLKEHVDAIHLLAKELQCPECKQQLSSFSSLRSHKQKLHSGKPVPKRERRFDYKCDECLRSFNSANVLAKHKTAVHKLEKNFSCEYPNCGLKFNTSNALLKHKRNQNHTDSQLFMCCAVNCQKGFLTRTALLDHELVHNKQFECSWPECDRKFTRMHNLKIHQKIHQNIKEFKCEFDGCQQSFATKGKLNQHLDRHRDPQPYKCEYIGCQRSFSHRISLVKHITKIHHGQIEGNNQLFGDNCVQQFN